MGIFIEILGCGLNYNYVYLIFEVLLGGCMEIGNFTEFDHYTF